MILFIVCQQKNIIINRFVKLLQKYHLFLYALTAGNLVKSFGPNSFRLVCFRRVPDILCPRLHLQTGLEASQEASIRNNGGSHL